MNFFPSITIIFLAVLFGGFSARADTVSVTFISTPTGISDGVNYVMPYSLSIDGAPTLAACYYIFDEVTGGQSWTANKLTIDQAASVGQFSSDTDALTKYKEIGFLSRQVTSSPQDQIDLQQDIWNIFAPERYPVTPGMQAYLNLIATSAYRDFDFSQVYFLEDVNQDTGRAQAFVPAASTPEPSTIVLMGASVLVIAAAKIRHSRKGEAGAVSSGPAKQ